MPFSIDPKLIALLQKLESDSLSDLGSLLIPALLAEVEALSPAVAQPVESLVFVAIQPSIQAALQSLIARVPKP